MCNIRPEDREEDDGYHGSQYYIIPLTLLFSNSTAQSSQFFTLIYHHLLHFLLVFFLAIQGVDCLLHGTDIVLDSSLAARYSMGALDTLRDRKPILQMPISLPEIAKEGSQ